MSAEPDNIELPDDLIEEMRRLDRSVSVLTPTVDRRVAIAATAHFRYRPARRRMPARPWAMAGTLAASVAIASLLLRIQFGIEPVPPANDMDGSGVVDILDALALARMAEDASGPSQARIDALVMDIVSLNRSPP